MHRQNIIVHEVTATFGGNEVAGTEEVHNTTPCGGSTIPCVYETPVTKKAPCVYEVPVTKKEDGSKNAYKVPITKKEDSSIIVSFCL